MKTQKTIDKRKLFETLKTIKTIAAEEVKSIETAYALAEKAHAGQKRKDGKTPYINHAIAAAYELAKTYRQSPQVINAGLLHDTIEDCGISLETIAENFGEETEFLVDGVTKMLRLENGKILTDKHATFRKLILYAGKDPRIILIKLCDVQHNCSEMQYLSENTREKFAVYARDFYVPLAREIGFEKLAQDIEKYSAEFNKKIPKKNILLKYADKNTLKKFKESLDAEK